MKAPEEIPNINAQDLEAYISQYIEIYFDELVKVVEFEEEFLKYNDLSGTKIDYFKLRRFLITAIRNLKELDPTLLVGLLAKTYHDVTLLFDCFNDWEQQTKIPNVVYSAFLTWLAPYKELDQELRKAIAAKGIYEAKMKQHEGELSRYVLPITDNKIVYEYNKIKGNYAESIHFSVLNRDRAQAISAELTRIQEVLKPYFAKHFVYVRDELLVRFKEVVNAKAYHLDKYLWYRASKSKTIQRFFINSHIDGNYDTKTFVKYYLKNINVNKLRDNEWHNYLVKLLETLD
jgi:hypothetical protein